MVFSQTASVLLTVSPIVVSRLTGPDWFGAQLVDHIYPALVAVGLSLTIQIASLHVGQFVVLLLRDLPSVVAMACFCLSSWCQ